MKALARLDHHQVSWLLSHTHRSWPGRDAHQHLPNGFRNNPQVFSHPHFKLDDSAHHHTVAATCHHVVHSLLKTDADRPTRYGHGISAHEQSPWPAPRAAAQLKDRRCRANSVPSGPQIARRPHVFMCANVSSLFHVHAPHPPQSGVLQTLPPPQRLRGPAAGSLRGRHPAARPPGPRGAVVRALPAGGTRGARRPPGKVGSSGLPHRGKPTLTCCQGRLKSNTKMHEA